MQSDRYLSNNMELMSRLTIFLFSADPSYLQRQLAFVRGWGSRIVVLDGSQNSQEAKDFIRQDEHPITYVHQVSTIARFKLAGSMPPTDFAMFMSDDDVFLPSGIAAALRELSTDNEIGTVVGPALGVGRDPYRPGFIGLYDIQADPFSDLNGRIGWKSVSKLAPSRIESFGFPYTSKLFYAISRGNILQKVCQTVGDLPPDQPELVANLGELLVEFGIIAMGSAKSTSVLFWLRSSERSSFVQEAKKSSRPDVFSYLKTGKAAIQKTMIKEVLGHAFSSEEISTSIVKAIYDIFPLNEKQSKTIKHHWGFTGRLRWNFRQITFIFLRRMSFLPVSLQPILLLLSLRFRRKYNKERAYASLLNEGITFSTLEIEDYLARMANSWQVSPKGSTT